MRKVITSLILCLICLIQINAVDIVPRPYRVCITKGSFQFTSECSISCEIKSDNLSSIISTFVDDMESDYGLRISYVTNSKATIYLRYDKKVAKEGYLLNVNPYRICIQASDDAGFFYGLKTIGQFVLADPNHMEIPCMDIQDFPRFSYRGFLMDSARYFIPIEDVKTIIDIASCYKLNIFHWHLTDDQGWRIEIKKYPKLTETGSVRAYSNTGTWDQYCPAHNDGMPHSGFYSQEELRDIVAYANQRNVTIIPEIEMPGHSSAMISCYPELTCSSNSNVTITAGLGITNHILCPKPSTFDFIEDVLTEVASIFPGDYIHIGADECQKSSWAECADCRRIIEDNGLEGTEALHAYFIQQLEIIGDKLGKKLIGWDEILEGGLPLKSTVMSWRGESGGIKAAKTGNDVIMCPNSHCYLDYYQEYPEYAPIAIGGYSPIEKVYSYDPIPVSLSTKEAEHILGIQGNIWGEFVPDIKSYEYLAFPRLLAIAEIGWSTIENKDLSRFLSNIKNQFDFFNLRGINACHEYFRPCFSTDLSEKGSLKVCMNNLSRDAIRYTVDGTFPDSGSALYSDPLELNGDAIITAASFTEDGEMISEPVRRRYVVNKATGCAYHMSSEPWSLDWYEVKDNLLTDGQKGFVPSNYEWFAISSGIQITIDLNVACDVHAIKFGTMVSPANSVYPAARAECYLSDDGVNFTQIGSSNFYYPPYKGEKKCFDNIIRTNGRCGRFLKIIITGQQDCMAIDEIEVF